MVIFHSVYGQQQFCTIPNSIFGPKHKVELSMSQIRQLNIDLFLSGRNLVAGNFTIGEAMFKRHSVLYRTTNV